MNYRIPIALSNRHLHLCQEHLDTLFGQGYQLKRTKDLSQPGQFACDEKVDIVGPKGELKRVRVLGPIRNNTQIELSISDAFKLGVKPVVKNSGDIEGTPGVKIMGPGGEIVLQKGTIVAARHIHMHSSDGNKYGIKDGDIVKVRTEGMRAVVFENVLVRVKDNFALEMHVDIEEGNAAGVENGDLVEMIKE